MAQYVSINYFFIFRKMDDGWQNIQSFEQDLADFFGAHGFDAEIVQTVEGSASRMVMLRKLDKDMFLTNIKGSNLKPQKALPQKSAPMVKNLVTQVTKFKKR